MMLLNINANSSTSEIYSDFQEPKMNQQEDRTEYDTIRCLYVENKDEYRNQVCLKCEEKH